jgi:hypothetical protein
MGEALGRRLFGIRAKEKGKRWITEGTEKGRQGEVVEILCP